MTLVASSLQKHAIELFLKNGGDKVDAYVRSRIRPLKASEKNLPAHARKFWNNSVMKALLAEANIQARLQIERRAQTGMETAIETYGITKERIMGELAKIAFAQQTDVMSWGPDGVVVKESTEIGDASAAVGEVSSSGGGDKPIVMKVKMLDKRAALIDLGREIGMFQQKVEHKGQVQMAVGAKFIIEGRD